MAPAHHHHAIGDLPLRPDQESSSTEARIARAAAFAQHESDGSHVEASGSVGSEDQLSSVGKLACKAQLLLVAAR
jgi:hypothetical protein